MATVSFNIPESLKSLLAAEWGDISKAAVESLAIESYRTGKLTINQVAELLSLDSRWDAERWLGERGVNWNYDIHEFEDDLRTLDDLLGEHP